MAASIIQKEIRRFLQENLLPVSDSMNESGEFPEKIFRDYFKGGYGTSFFPEEWGGDGDFLGYLRNVEEMGRVDAGFALSAMANAVLFGNNVLLHGSQEQKQKYLPGIANGTQIGCWALTEPSAGSDALSIQTTAEKKDDFYILNGSKTFITNAPVADSFLVLARLKGTEGQGIEGGCAFLLDRGMPGLTTGTAFKKMGHRTSPTGEIFLQNCRVSVSQRLGKEGKAFYDMKRSLDFERMSFSSIGIGMVDELLKIMIPYAAERKQFGKPILEQELIQEKITEIGAEFESLKAYCESVYPKMVQGEKITLEGSIIEFLLSRLVVRAADHAIQTLGGYGYMTEYRVERFYRDAKLYEIGGGTSEIQKLIIAKEISRRYLMS